jgi:hypothetical protein
MRRHVRVALLSRLRLSSALRNLEYTEPAKWPAPLQRAWKILHDELGVTTPVARTIVADAALAAHNCAQKINDRVRANEHNRLAAKLGSGFARLSNCIRRAPAEIRGLLDGRIRTLLAIEVFDTEVIEEILDAAVVCFQQYPEHEAAKTALATMLVASTDGGHVNALKLDYSGLDYDSRMNCEKVPATLVSSTVTAAAVFEALASALAVAPLVSIRHEANDLIIGYVRSVAMLWRRTGLRTSRARHPFDPRYTSRFHRFAELVLTAVVDPWTHRHDVDLDELRWQARTAHAALPKELRGVVSAAPRRGDVEWLVTDDQVKKALAAFKNRTPIHHKR